MFPAPHLPYETGRRLRPDRRPLPRAGEIRIRVKRTLHREED
ncbi:MAG TPA: hypothetical protein VE984_04870 [Gaiellaceae bacterium]|nr:hypothetical protein [Gaiellaceae bacterium]